MKIMLFTESLTSGGAERQIVELAKGMKANGHDIIVSFYRKYYHYKNELTKNEIRVEEFRKNGKFDLKFIINLAKFIKDEQPDFIISYKTIPNIFILLAAKIVNYKNIIISERNTDIEVHKKYISMEKLLSSKAKYVVCNSTTMSKLLVEKIGFKNEKVRTIHNGIDVNGLRNYSPDKLIDFKDGLGIKKENFNICLVGRIAEQKNHELLINAVDEIIKCKKYKNIMVYCVGDIRDEKLYCRLQNLIKNLEIENNIVFKNAINDIKYLYYAMDIVVLPSLYEGFPNVVLEAMCCSKIVLASNVSDNSYIIEDGVNGFIFENNNLEQIIQKLNIIICMDDEKRKVIGKKAADKISVNYSRENMVKKYDALIRENTGEI